MLAHERTERSRVAAFKIIPSNVVARLVLNTSGSREEVHATLDQMRAECRRATGSPSATRGAGPHGLNLGGPRATETLLDRPFGRAPYGLARGRILQRVC